MATYDFRCDEHGLTTVSLPMSAVTPTTPCPACARPARRIYSSPQLRLGDSSARRLLDATARTAEQPAVVGAPLGRRLSGSRRPVTADPRTAKLPRP